jgi:hypothetical protein
MKNVVKHQDQSFIQKLKDTTLATIGAQPAKQKLSQAKFMKAVKKIALGTKVLRAATEGSDADAPQRHVFAVGRVRPSALHAQGDGKRRLRDRSDQRLYGRAFVIFESRQEAYDAMLRFDDKPFILQQTSVQGENKVVEWVPLKEEAPLKMEVTGRQAQQRNLTQAAQVVLSFTLVACSNLPKKDLLGSCDAYVLVKYEGYEFKSDTVKNSLDPQFNKTFELNIMDKDDPGKITLVVMDWDRLTKDDEIGSCVVSSEMLKSMFSDETHEGPEDLRLLRNSEEVVGKNKQPSSIRIRWTTKR